MIVKDEIANLERCLGRLRLTFPTGSLAIPDRATVLPNSFAPFSLRAIFQELHQFPFVDFAQARNAALDRAQVCTPGKSP
jgi:hypothetical protein